MEKIKVRCYNCQNSVFEKVDKDYKCFRMPKCLMEDVERREKYSQFDIRIGSKIRFKGEKRFYTIRAFDSRFIIAYRNWRKDYYYVICDLEECIRGADNYSSCGGYYDYKNCSDLELREALYRLHMKNPKLIKDCIDLPEDIKQRQLKIMNTFNKIPEDKQWLDNLEISYRRWVPLDIEEVK